MDEQQAGHSCRGQVLHVARVPRPLQDGNAVLGDEEGDDLPQITFPDNGTEPRAGRHDRLRSHATIRNHVLLRDHTVVGQRP
jgi:hypothetical protein